jgi:nicotinate phosphoribosyltransferase
MTSVLETDGYKFSMAEAGWPLREETFYYSHRKGGPAILPLDVEAFIKKNLPFPPLDMAYLEANEYDLGIGAQTALGNHRDLKINALPQFSIFYPGEPVFSITGPSALVSWFEPKLLQLNWLIQAATLAVSNPDDFRKQMAIRNCAEEILMLRELLDTLKIKAPPMDARPDEYRRSVFQTARALVQAVDDPDRVFEVGLRSATCRAMHLMALASCKEAGIKRTSHVDGARELKMKPVGTMGHEHVMRYGSDEAAFRAMRDRRPYRSSYLLDTYDTFLSGLPAAFKVMSESPRRGDSIRYDSGNKEAQYLYAVSKAKEAGLEPVHILEDALDLEQTVRFEILRKQLGVPASQQVYGYGGALVAKPGFGNLHRDRVAAVYKLSQTGPKAVMKFGNEAKSGKISIPGRPVVWRRIGAPGDEPPGVIAQESEKYIRGGYQLASEMTPSLTDLDTRWAAAENASESSVWSGETIILRNDLMAEAKKALS